MMAIETLRFLRDLVNGQQISAANPDIVALAALIRKVRDELDAAIAATEGEHSNDLSGSG